MPNFTLSDEQTREIDLGNSATLTVTNLTGTSAQIYIDYKHGSSYTSAIKASAGYGDPFTLAGNGSKVVQRTDLESEHVRVGVKGTNASVKFSY